MLLTKTQISKASDKDLQQAEAAIKAEIVRRSSTTKSDLLKKMKKMAADAGVTLDELLGKAPKAAATPKASTAKPSGGKRGSSKPRGKVAPKYANPADASLVWTGRGRQPLWVSEALAAGKTLTDLLIK